ncbi:4Fe-4S binding protein [Serratia microhaemolytica]|uniref:4Fe-4S binding protein n=1 Tax=Serratia microhaemolytica TaxID=2675110 RepID=UPI000FDE4B60|nr:4Fe-4S dicluster domain-containing protein [Serratia microhaemolytica]
MNKLIVADAEKCIGCRTCELACALAHGQSTKLQPQNFMPRLQIVKTRHVSVPIICHQCENAPCAKVCPHDAIVRADGYWEVIQSRCIGCKSCVVACPFGAINVVLSAQETKEPCGEAHKCDLCHDHASGPACINVCPTDALTLVNDSDLQQMVSAKQLRTATSDARISSQVTASFR